MIRTEVDDLRDILNKYPEAYAKILDDGDIYDNEELYNELFEYCWKICLMVLKKLEMETQFNG